MLRFVPNSAHAVVWQIHTFLHQVLLGERSSHTTRPSHDVGDEPIVSGSCRASRMMAAVFPCDLVIRFCAQITSHQRLRWSRFHSICSHHCRRQTPANVPCCACTAASCERSARSCGESCSLRSGTVLLQRNSTSNARATSKTVPHHHIHRVRRCCPTLCWRAVLAVLVALVCLLSSKILLDPSCTAPQLTLQPLSALAEARRAAGRVCL